MMMAQKWDAWVGRTQVQHDLLTPALAARFRATLDLGEDAPPAPDGLHWCLCTPDAATVRLGEDGHPRRDDDPGSFLPPIPLPRRMWASSKLAFHAPLTLGALIARRSTIASIAEKTGGTGALVFVEIDHATCSDGVLAVAERQTLVYRAPAPLTAPAPPAPSVAADTSDWPQVRTLIPSAPLLFRYSALTFNSHRIHYDLPYARDVEGYAGLVVHGPLIATLLLGHVQQASPGARIASFAFRAAAPSFVDAPLHLCARVAGSTVTLAAIGDDGTVRCTAEAQLA